MKVLPDLYQKTALSIDFGRQLVLFGAGNVAHKTLRFLDTEELELIFDNGGTLWGEFQGGIKICQAKLQKLRPFKRLHHNLFSIF